MKRILSSLTMAIIAAGCGAPQDNSDSKSIVSTNFRWPNPSAIPVCWSNPGQVSQEIKDTVKNKIIAEYHSKTGIRFTRFDNCVSSDLSAKMIRVHFHLTHSWAGTSGFSAGGGLSYVGGVVGSLGGTGANGTMRIDIGTSGQYPASGHVHRQFAIDQTLGTAVHEFGHAVGLLHEHERTDAANCNDQVRQGAGGHIVYVGAYDPASIMNYCKKNNINSLTAGDAAGVNFLYPNSVPTSSAAFAGEFYLKPRHSGMCVDISNSSKTAGENVQQWSCNGSGAQRFRFLPASDGTYSIQNVHSGMCLDAAGATDGANVRQWHCAGVAHQRFRLNPGRTGSYFLQFAHSSKCLDVGGALKTVGANIHQWACGMNVSNEEYDLVKVQ